MPEQVVLLEENRDALIVAVIQLCSGDDRMANLERAADLIRLAADQGAELVLLPENFSLMGVDDAVKREMAEDASDSCVFRFLSEQAAKYGMAIIGGTLLLHGADGRLRNACPVFDRFGKQIAIYDKIHLFDMQYGDERYCESDLVAAGERPVVIAVNGFRIGLSVCYDLRFPELYRAYADQRCDLLCNVAAFTEATGQAHWRTLLCSRAIENQAYMLAAAQWGEHPDGRRTWGHSAIVDPWGEIETELAEGEGVRIGRVTKARLNEIRSALPALQHRRL